MKKTSATRAARVATRSAAAALSLKTTAAAWTVSEVSGRAVDAGLVHMPSTNSARVFLAVFGIILLAEIVHAAKGEIKNIENEHAPEKRPAVIARMATDDERKPATLRDFVTTSDD